MSAELLENRLLLSTTNLAPSDDAYVRDGSYNTTNFGSDTQLVVKTDTGSGFTRQSFIKFSLSSLTAGAGIVSADLKLYGDDSSNSENVYVDADNTGSTSWAENTITWNTKPSYASPYLDQETLSSTTNAWYDWTVTSYARTQLAASSPVSLALYGDTNTNSGGFFSSKEATDSTKRPYLAVVTLLAPTGPSATANSSSQVTVNWTDASDNEDGFKVQRSSDGGTTWSTLTTTAANATSYADTSVSASTTYKYRVLSTKTSVVDSSPTSAVTVTTPAAGVTNTLAATDDTFVRDGSFDTTANGSSTTFLTKNTTTANGGFNRNIYVKFDSSTIDGTPSSAKIRLYGAAISGTESATVSAYSVSDTTWSEGTLTWSTQPSHGSSVANVTMSSATAAWYEWDVTSYVNTQRGLGNKVVAFMIQSGTTTNTGYQFNSKENGTNPPQFQVIWPGTPTAPSGLSATASGTTVNLAWTDNSGSESGFKIERATDSGFTTNDSIISTTAANATTYADTGLTASTTYYYRVRATNSNGDSANSSSASATTTASTPTAPSGLSATAVTGGTVNLAWTDNSSNETGFKVERATDSAFTTNASILTTTAANATSYSDTATTPGTTYYYRVRATNAAGDSANSTPTTGTTALPYAPGTPTALTATAVSGGQINLAWTAPGTSSTVGAASGYRIDRSTDNSTWSVLTTLGSVTSYADTGLTAGLSFYYHVWSINAAGTSATSAATSGTIALPALPNAPTGLSATAIASGQIDLSWTAGTGGGSATGYQIERSIDNTTWSALTSGGTVTSYSDTTVLPSTAYYYRVHAVNAAGSSSNATSSVVTTPAGLAAPSDLSAISISGSEIDLSWVDNSSNETGFQIQRATNIGFTSNVTLLATTAAGVTSYADTSVTNQTTYYYRVRAVNTSESSSYTEAVGETPNDAPAISDASADPETVTGTTTTLSVTATDDGGESNLRYNWTIAGTVAADAMPILSEDGMNSSKSVTVTFTRAGEFTFDIEAVDEFGVSATSSVTVTVEQTFSSLKLNQKGAAIQWEGVNTFEATAFDQFGQEMTLPTGIDWSVDGNGSINSDGIYTAPSTGGGTDTVTATYNGQSDSALVEYGYLVGHIFSSDATGEVEIGPADGWEVYVADSLGNHVQTTHTDATGNYEFDRDPGWDAIYGCGMTVCYDTMTGAPMALSAVPAPSGNPAVSPPAPVPARGPLTGFLIEAVDFSANTPARFHPVRIDGTDWVGSSDQWQDFDHNGVPTTSGEKNFPISYTRSGASGSNVVMNLHAKLYNMSGGALPSGNYQVKARVTVEDYITGTNEGTWVFSPTAGSISTYQNYLTNLPDNVIVADLTSPNFIIPPTVGIKIYYINFFVNYNSMGWMDSGTSGTKAFITMVDPPTIWSYTAAIPNPVPSLSYAGDTINAPLETVLEIGCRAANGQSVAATNTISGIWASFVSQRAVGVMDAHGRHMAYWAGGQADPNSPDLTATPPRMGRGPLWGTVTNLIAISDGPCEAWSRLLVDVFRSQGVPANVFGLDPNVPAINALAISPAGFSLIQGLKVKSSDGQGVGGSAQYFTNHAIVELSSTGNGPVLDPSYGKWYPSETAWQDEAVEGIMFQDSSGSLYKNGATPISLPTERFI